MKKAIQTGIIFVAALVFTALCPSAWAIGFSAEEIYESVFVIETDRAIGSGFAISENEVITNAHVISGARTISVFSYEGKEYSAIPSAYDEDLDLALLYVKDASFTPVILGSRDDIRAGDDVYAIGAPKSMVYTITKGIISSASRIIRRQEFIQVDAAINEGNSGGPLLNADGKAIGVITWKMADAEGIGMAIPITVVSDWKNGNGPSMPETPEPVQFGPSEDSTISVEPSGTEQPPVTNRSAEKTIAALVIALSISFMINVVQTVVILRKNKKEKPVPSRSHDRTDFEIEFED